MEVFDMRMQNWSGLIIGVVLTALLLAIGHWFPWLDRNRRIRNYSYGTASIIAGFAVWRLPAGDWVSVVGLLLIAIVGGLVVIGAHEADRTQQQIRQARMAGMSDDELSE
jgi:MFS family permease